MPPTKTVALGALALATLPFATGGQPSKKPEGTDPGRHVVLVVVDTLRADHLGVGGARRDATPGLDRLARRGRWLTDAWSTAPWTPPSVMSIMTSLDPAVHGLADDGDSLARRRVRLAAPVRTLAQVLHERGWRTRGVTGGGGVGRRYGFDRGFELYDEPGSPASEDVLEGVDRGLAWLAGLGADERGFLFLHTYEVHQPDTHHLFADEERGTPAQRAAAAYDGDVAFADRELARLFDGLERRGLLERSVVVVTADHGENLHDRSAGGRPVEHGHHLHGELLHVPLIVVAPGLVPPLGALAGPASTLDVAPTVLSLLGVTGEMPLAQGQDLRAALQGEGTLDPDRPLFAGAPLQGPTWRVVRSGRSRLILAPPVSSGGWWREVREPEAARYDVRADPAETHPLAASDGEARRLRALLRDRERQQAERLRQLGPPEFDVQPPDELRALGYLR